MTGGQKSVLDLVRKRKRLLGRPSKELVDGVKQGLEKTGALH